MISGAPELQFLSLSDFEFQWLKTRSRKTVGSNPCTVRTGTAGQVEIFITQVAKDNEVSHFHKASIGPPGGTCYLRTGSLITPCSLEYMAGSKSELGKDSRATLG